MKKSVKLIIVILSFIIIFSFGKKTYSSLYYKTNGNTDIAIAKFKIKVNNQDIKENNQIDISNIVFDNAHANSNTVAPGSSGVLDLLIDPSESEVSVKYTISVIDHNTDSNKILTVEKVTINDIETTINNNQITGIFSLNEIKNSVKKDIKIYVKWVNNEDNNIIDSKIGQGEINSDFLSVKLNAEQYKG